MKVKEFAEIKNGFAFKSEKYVDSGIRVIRINNVQKGYIADDTPAFYPISENNNILEYMLEKDDILLSLTGNVGRAALLDEKFLPAALNQRVACIRINDNNVLKKYIYYALLSKKFEQDCIKSSQGIAQKNMSTEWLKEYDINVVKKEKQKDIVNVFDLLTNSIKLYESQLKHFDNLVKSRFVEMFGDVDKPKYDVKKLGEVAKVGSSHRVFTEEFVEDGIPFYRGTEIGKLANGEKLEDIYYISKEHYERLACDDSKPQIGDLLMPSICDKGQVWMVDTNAPFYYKDGRVLSISPDRKLFNSKFLQIYMKNKTEEEYPKLGSGSTFAEFKIFILKDLDIIVPPMKIQNDFASFVDQVDKSKFAVQKALEKTKMLMDSLMQEYFG